MPLKQTYSYEFERFWKSYPRKVNKGQAWKAFEKMKFTALDVDELVAHLEERKKFDAKWLEGKFVPHAASFINGHRWEDEYQRVSNRNGRKGWGGHTPTDEENKLRFVQDCLKRNQQIPPEYRQYEEAARRGMQH